LNCNFNGNGNGNGNGNFNGNGNGNGNHPIAFIECAMQSGMDHGRQP
jgi:hypothetical protein